jgi:hypothetical protein
MPANLPTVRNGVTFSYAPGTAGLRVIGARYSDHELHYLATRLEGADCCIGRFDVCAHRTGTLTIRLNRRLLGRHIPSAQSLADYVHGAIG